MDFLKYFRNEDEEAKAIALETARTILDWTGREYHKKFIKWLDEQMSKPFAISESNSAMIQSVVRANTMREIKAHLEKIEAQAVAAVQDAREDL